LILWTIAALTMAIAVVYALFLVRQALLLLYVSALLAVGFSPLVRLIEGQKLLPIGPRRLPHWVAILVVYVIILSVITGIMLTVLPPFVRQARDFATNVPKMVEQAQQFLVDRHILTAQLTWGQLVQQAPASSDMVGTIMLTVWGLFGGVLGIVTVLILTFYLLIESESFFNAFVRVFPKQHRAQVRDAGREITIKLSGWLSGQLILATVIGLTTAVGLGLIGMPYFYVLALLAAAGELIPYVGPILGAIPGLAVAATMSWKLALGVTLFYLAQQQFESNLLVPKLMERQVGLSAGAVVIAMLLGVSLLGILGAILAVPTAAILQVIYQELTPADDG